MLWGYLGPSSHRHYAFLSWPRTEQTCFVGLDTVGFSGSKFHCCTSSHHWWHQTLQDPHHPASMIDDKQSLHGIPLHQFLTGLAKRSGMHQRMKSYHGY